MTSYHRPAQRGASAGGAGWKTIALVLIGCVMMFLVLQVGVTWLAARLDSTWSALLASAMMLGLALALERAFFGQPVPHAFRQLGFGRPGVQAVLVAVIIGMLMLAFFPVLSLVTGARLSLKGDWLWVLVGAVALNGLAEETLFRGWVFGHLRHFGGLTFGRAAFISMLIFAAVHLLLAFYNPLVIALAAALVAVAASFPVAYLFERGGNTIWAPAILHVAAHAIRLVDIPESVFMPSVLAWLGLQIVAAFLVFAFRGNLLK